MNKDTWTGQERRSAPLHIINYIDGRMREHTERVEKILRDHIAEEMLPFGEIQSALKESREGSEARHAELVAQITAHRSRVEHLESAFIETDHGGLDVIGHKQDHSMRKTTAEWWDSVKKSSTTKVIEYTLVAVLAWVGIAMWNAFLKGPKP